MRSAGCFYLFLLFLVWIRLLWGTRSSKKQNDVQIETRAVLRSDKGQTNGYHSNKNKRSVWMSVKVKVVFRDGLGKYITCVLQLCSDVYIMGMDVMVILGFFTGGIILQHKSLITLFWILSNPHRLTVIDAYLVKCPLALTKSICHNSVSPWPNWVHLAAVWDLGFEPHQLLSLWPDNSLPCLAKKHVQLQTSVTITGVSFGAGGSFLVSALRVHGEPSRHCGQGHWNAWALVLDCPWSLDFLS